MVEIGLIYDKLSFDRMQFGERQKQLNKLIFFFNSQFERLDKYLLTLVVKRIYRLYCGMQEWHAIKICNDTNWNSLSWQKNSQSLFCLYVQNIFQSNRVMQNYLELYSMHSQIVATLRILPVYLFPAEKKYISEEIRK